MTGCLSSSLRAQPTSCATWSANPQGTGPLARIRSPRSVTAGVTPPSILFDGEEGHRRGRNCRTGNLEVGSACEECTQDESTHVAGWMAAGNEIRTLIADDSD